MVDVQARHGRYERDVLLRDGSTVHLRPIHPNDDPAIQALYSRLSERSLYLRFHRPVRHVPEEELGVARVDPHETFALVAVHGEPPDQRVIAVGRYSRFPEDLSRAEIAFTVEDSHQGRGIASQLLDHLALIARDHGIETFEADVLGENRSMLEVFRESGFPVQSKLIYGTYHVAFPIGETEAAEERVARHEMTAAAASIRFFFQPKSVAVIGASRQRGTIGAEVFNNILKDGYQGTVYPVNPSAESVGGVRAYPSVLDIPNEIEMAIVIVPAEHVLEVADECARKGVRGIVVISAGFRETGDEGRERERALLQKARSFGMRIIGPNCMGVLNANPEVSLNGTFAPNFPPFGNVALLSQSGALGLALLDYSRDLNIGLSTFVSVGNKADVSGNDLIQYWESDPDTDVILLYLESFGNPRKFSRHAQRIGPHKPIVAVKSGRSTAGSRAAASHTGALATLDVASDALFRQAGVIRVDTLEELFDVANLLAHQPVPKGKRVAIITNAGGPGILCADACESYGLEVAGLTDETREKLQSFLPKEAGLNNPIDMVASATAEDYARTLQLLVDDDSIDSVIVIFIPPLITQAADVGRAIRKVAAKVTDKTLLACFMTTRGAPPELVEGKESALPSFVFPESAAHALARVSEYGEWRLRPIGKTPEFEADSARARRIVEDALKAGADRVWAPQDICAQLLSCYGLRSAEVALAATAEEAAHAAARIGFPVAIKLSSSTIVHKSDLGGVMLGIGSEAAAHDAFEKIRAGLEEIGRAGEMDGVLVQQMVPQGIEAIVGVTQDPTFGPLMMFGLGGTFVELLKDVNFRIHPLTDIDAREMVRSIKGFPLLQGWRGSTPGDVQSLEETLLRVSVMVEQLPEIAEMDLNPIKVLPPGEGCIAVDARILLRPAPEQ